MDVTVDGVSVDTLKKQPSWNELSKLMIAEKGNKKGPL
jgi:hypothetical protein